MYVCVAYVLFCCTCAGIPTTTTVSTCRCVCVTTFGGFRLLLARTGIGIASACPSFLYMSCCDRRSCRCLRCLLPQSVGEYSKFAGSLFRRRRGSYLAWLGLRDLLYEQDVACRAGEERSDRPVPDGGRAQVHDRSSNRWAVRRHVCCCHRGDSLSKAKHTVWGRGGSCRRSTTSRRAHTRLHTPIQNIKRKHKHRQAVVCVTFTRVS